MNQCHFLGNLTRDPELKSTAGGKQVVNFGIAVNRKFKRGSEMVNEASFLDLEAWDTGAETIAKYFKKGDPIIVHCSVKQETWDDKNSGTKRSKIKFRVNNFEFVPGAKKTSDATEAGSETTNPARTNPTSDNAMTLDEDIPF